MQAIGSHNCDNYIDIRIVYWEVFRNGSEGPDIPVPLLESESYKTLGGLKENSTYEFYAQVHNNGNYQQVFSHTAQVMLTQGAIRVLMAKKFCSKPCALFRGIQHSRVLLINHTSTDEHGDGEFGVRRQRWRHRLRQHRTGCDWCCSGDLSCHCGCSC